MRKLLTAKKLKERKDSETKHLDDEAAYQARREIIRQGMRTPNDGESRGDVRVSIARQMAAALNLPLEVFTGSPIPTIGGGAMDEQLRLQQQRQVQPLRSDRFFNQGITALQVSCGDNALGGGTGRLPSAESGISLGPRFSQQQQQIEPTQSTWAGQLADIAENANLIAHVGAFPERYSRQAEDLFCVTIMGAEPLQLLRYVSIVLFVGVARRMQWKVVLADGTVEELQPSWHINIAISRWLASNDEVYTVLDEQNNGGDNGGNIG